MEILLSKAFEFVFAAIGAILLMYFRDMKNDLKNMSASMIEMNTTLTTVVTKHDNTEYIAKRNAEDLKTLREKIHKIEGDQGIANNLIMDIKENMDGH